MRRGVHKNEIERVLAQYRGTPREELPPQLRNPRGEHQFGLAFALMAIETFPDASPIYNNAGFLVGWRGISLKER